MNIHELARQRAAAEIVVQELGLMNTSPDYETRLKQDAAYRLARDALAKAQSDYSSAIANLSAAELSALVGGG